ncbi:hypothetical protein [Dactylosporangium sp. NPDC051484]|uniref:hypothetical protein n=1 Tax=Dactylosporangium sp. NPDC051484 TaxID=3154942 RepID=UPI00344CDFEC
MARWRRTPTSTRLGDAIGLTPGGTALIAAPLHAAAIFETVIRQLLAGGTVVLQPDFTPAGWLHTAAETRADWAVLAPGQIKALLRTREQRPGRLAAATQALRRVVVPATVPLPGAGNHLADFATAADVTVTTWYHAPAYDGATTTTSTTATALDALPGLRLRTIDPAGQPTPPGVAGLIEAASASCTAVAHRADQPCPPSSAWRTSGDIGTLTLSGRLTLHRLESAEHYLAPTGQRRCAALRRTVTAHPDVAAAAVYIVPDEYNRPRAQLRVWPRPGLTTPLTAAMIAAHCTTQDTPVFAHHILVAAARTQDTVAGVR